VRVDSVGIEAQGEAACGGHRHAAVGGLGAHHPIRVVVVLGELIAAALQRLLARRPHHHELAAKLHSSLPQPVHRREHGGEATLHVGGAAAVVAVAAPLPQGIHGHPLEGERVDVAGDAELGPGRAERALHVEGARHPGARAKLGSQPHLRHQVTTHLHARRLVARDAGDGDQFLQEILAALFVAHRFTRLSGGRIDP
jgi:hypothetical protein